MASERAVRVGIEPDLLLYAENDWDGDAKALIDEFSDAICACIQGGFEGDIKILAIDNAPGQK